MFMYSHKKNWKEYLSPKLLNSITYKDGKTKIYRWLIFGWTISI